MTERVTRPLSIADLLVATATVAVALAICRATGWNLVASLFACVFGPVLIHAIVFARAWGRATGLAVAFSVSMLSLLSAYLLALNYIGVMIEYRRNYGVEYAMYAMASIEVALFIAPHFVIRWMHQGYRRRADSNRTAASESPFQSTGAAVAPQKNPAEPRGPDGVQS